MMEDFTDYAKGSGINVVDARGTYYLIVSREENRTIIDMYGDAGRNHFIQRSKHFRGNGMTHSFIYRDRAMTHLLDTYVSEEDV